MPEVTCPDCHTRQPVDPSSSGYACVSCGAEWDFVACASCGSRFHARPDAATWRCPACGHENARRHVATGRAAASPGPNRSLVLAGVGVLVVLLVAFALTRGDGDGATAASPTGGASPTAAGGTATESLCGHLVGIQSVRFDALGRTSRDLADDAAAIRAEGDEALAADVEALAAAVRELADAFDTPGTEDDDAATQAVLDALEPIPC
ncbi:MAG TPA: hypothetical protein VF044_03620 [Actinomycetota bacterium]